MVCKGRRVLRVRAAWMHDITGVYGLKSTTPSYIESELPLHLYNLSIIRKLGNHFLTDYLHAVKTSNPTTLSVSEISTWTSFMRKILCSDPTRASHLLTKMLKPRSNTSIFSKRLTTLSQTHIQITNHLSRQKITTFTSTPHPYAPARTSHIVPRRPKLAFSGPHTFSPTGRCSADVKAGDQIILLEDISQPLVVRRIPGGSEREVQIVSLVDYKEGIPEGCEFEEAGWWDVH
jgi:hypothetical protein